MPLRGPAVFLALALLAAPSARAQFADAVTATPITGPLWMLTGAGDVITASVGPDGILLVDNGFPQTVDSVRAALRRLSGSAVPQVIVNSHWHHTGANEAFAAEAMIIAHARTRDRLREGALMYTRPMPAREAAAFPDLVLADSLSLWFNGERVDLLYLPASHTDTDLAVLFTGSRVAALGDLFVPFIPVTDYGSGGDLYASVRAVERLLDRLDPTWKIVPGHGRLSTYEDLRGFHGMLKGMIAHVEQAIDAGRTMEQVVAGGIPAAWQSWMGDLLTPEFVLQNFYEGVRRVPRDRRLTTP